MEIKKVVWHARVFPDPEYDFTVETLCGVTCKWEHSLPMWMLVGRRTPEDCPACCRILDVREKLLPPEEVPW